MKPLNTNSWMILTITASAMLLVAVGWIGHRGMDQGEARLRDTYLNETVQGIQLKTVHDAYAGAIPGACRQALAGTISFDQARQTIWSAKERADSAWRAAVSNTLSPVEQDLVSKILVAKVPLDAALRDLAGVLDKEDPVRLRALQASVLDPVGERFCQQLDAFCFAQEGETSQDLADLELVFSRMKAILIGAVVAGIALAGLAAVLARFLVRTQRVLHESETRYRSLVTATAQIVWTLDPDGNLVTDNPAWRTLTGQSFQEIKNMGWLEAMHPDDRECVGARMKAALAAPAQLEGECRVRRQDGQYRCFMVRAVPVLDSAGLVREWVGTCLDITERKEVERRRNLTHSLVELFAHKSSAKEYSNAVLELIRNCVGCDATGIVLAKEEHLFWTGSEENTGELGKNRLHTKSQCACFRAVLGRSEQFGPGMMTSGGSFSCANVPEFFRGLTPEQKASHCNKCLKRGFGSVAMVPIRYEEKILGAIHLAGFRHHQFPTADLEFLESVSPLIGEAIHRFQVEQAVRDSAGLFRVLFESHQAVMLLIAPNTGAIVEANPAAAEFYSFSTEALRLMNLGDLRIILPEIADADGPLETTTRLCNGEIRSVEIHASAVTVQGQQRWFAILHDITERKESEKMLAKTNEEERQHIGRDLHESLGQKLTGAALVNKRLSQALAQQSVPESSMADEIGQYLKEAIGEARALAKEACPVGLSPAGLIGGLHEFASKMEKISGVACRVRAEESLRVESELTAAHLFRIITVAVNRAIEQGKAYQISIELTQKADILVLEVKSDGSVLADDSDAIAGTRLRTMRHLANAIGGRLEIESAPEGGETVRCILSWRKP